MRAKIKLGIGKYMCMDLLIGKRYFLRVEFHPCDTHPMYMYEQ